MTDSQRGRTENEEYYIYRKERHPLPRPCPPRATDNEHRKYGHMRLDYLKTYRKAQYTTLLTQGVLAAHLSALDAAARYIVEKTTTELAKQRGIDENLKSTDPIRWTREMNNCKAAAEEIALQEVIYT